MGYFSKLDAENRELGICQDEPEMDIEYFIKEEANCTALKEYKKPLNKLNDYEQKTCIEIAERHVLGIWYEN